MSRIDLSTFSDIIELAKMEFFKNKGVYADSLLLPSAYSHVFNSLETICGLKVRFSSALESEIVLANTEKSIMG